MLEVHLHELVFEIAVIGGVDTVHIAIVVRAGTSAVDAEASIPSDRMCWSYVAGPPPRVDDSDAGPSATANRRQV